MLSNTVIDGSPDGWNQSSTVTSWTFPPPPQGERRRFCGRIAIEFSESTVNTLVGKRFNKRQQRTKQGALRFLHMRVETGNGLGCRGLFSLQHRYLFRKSRVSALNGITEGESSAPHHYEVEVRQPYLTVQNHIV